MNKIELITLKDGSEWAVWQNGTNMKVTSKENYEEMYMNCNKVIECQDFSSVEEVKNYMNEYFVK